MPSCPAHVPVVEVQSAGAEDRHGHVELRAPVGDDGTAEEALRPLVHLVGDAGGDLEEHGLARQRQAQVALVVERHRRALPERVLAVEHPAIGAREQRVGDVAQAGVERRRRGGPPVRCPESTDGRARPGSRRHRTGRPAHRPRQSRCGRWWRRPTGSRRAPVRCRPRRPARQPGLHQRPALAIEGREQFERRDGRRREDVGVARGEGAADLQRAGGLMGGRDDSAWRRSVSQSACAAQRTCASPLTSRPRGIQRHPMTSRVLAAVALALLPAAGVWRRRPHRRPPASRSRDRRPIVAGPPARRRAAAARLRRLPPGRAVDVRMGRAGRAPRRRGSHHRHHDLPRPSAGGSTRR